MSLAKGGINESQGGQGRVETNTKGYLRRKYKKGSTSVAHLTLPTRPTPNPRALLEVEGCMATGAGPSRWLQRRVEQIGWDRGKKGGNGAHKKAERKTLSRF